MYTVIDQILKSYINKLTKESSHEKWGYLENVTVLLFLVDEQNIRWKVYKKVIILSQRRIN